MEKLVISERDAKYLNLLKLDFRCHNESNLYLSPFNKDEIIKCYYNTKKPGTREARLKTIENYLEFINNEDIPELLKPSKYFYIGKNFRGLVLPRIYGKNASFYLENESVPLNIKIEILKQIGNILQIIKNAPSKYGAAFADVHNDNFMVTSLDLEKNNLDFKTIGIDAESMKVLDNPGQSNVYLITNSKLDLPKYEHSSLIMMKPSSETDIYCFAMMILELISSNNCIFSISLQDYFWYLDYLDKLGMDTKLLESLRSVCEDKDSINPLPYLDNIKEIPKEANYKVYRSKNGSY